MEGCKENTAGKKKISEKIPIPRKNYKIQSGEKAESRKQKVESRKWKAESRKQKAESGKQKLQANL